MNWKYFIGRQTSGIIDFFLSSKGMPLLDAVPHGLSWPFDVKRFSGDKNKHVIFDVGAHRGETSLYLNKFFPEADIFAFEPVKDNFKDLQELTRHKKQIRCFNTAMGSKETDMEILINPDSERNSLVEKPFMPGQRREHIKVTAIDKFCAENKISHIDILKSDTEGYDLEVMKGAQAMLDKNSVQFIYSEIGFEPSDVEKTLLGDLYDYLGAKRFKLCGFYENFYWGEKKQFFGFCNALFINPEFRKEQNKPL